MTKICVFAGTTEGRKLVEFLSSQPVAVTACVATEYGETLLTPSENLTVSAHRLTEKEMERMLREEGGTNGTLNSSDPVSPTRGLYA